MQQSRFFFFFFFFFFFCLFVCLFFFFFSTSIAIYFLKICFLAVPSGIPCVLDASISGVEWSVCLCSLNIGIVVVFQVVNSFLGHVQH